MDKTFLGNSANECWLTALKEIYSRGRAVQPRGIYCKEIINARTVIPMSLPIVTVAERELGYRFMFAEAFWIITGDNRVETIKPYSKEISRFSDDGVTFFGAYGPKITSQMDYVINTLLNDKDSRQAVMTIWRENPPRTKDVPCTISLQFLIRDGYLHCIDNMRSSDIWLGWPYDVFNFSMLSAYIALTLRSNFDFKVELGDLHMNLGSFHLYNSNFKKANDCINRISYAFHDLISRPLFTYPELSLDEFTGPAHLLLHLQGVFEQKPEMLLIPWCKDIAEGKYNKGAK